MKINLKTLIKDNKLNEWLVYDFLDKNDNYAGASKTGFFGVVFKNKVTGKFVVAFRGTNGLADFKTDAVLATKKSDIGQIAYARKLLAKIPSKVSSKDIFLTGHSLGGYIAARMGAEKNLKTTTFNAPGFHKDLLSTLKKSGKLKYEKQVTNHNIESDYVSGAGTQIGNVSVKPSKWNWPAWDIHALTTFYQFIK